MDKTSASSSTRHSKAKTKLIVPKGFKSPGKTTRSILHRFRHTSYHGKGSKIHRRGKNPNDCSGLNEERQKRLYKPQTKSSIKSSIKSSNKSSIKSSRKNSVMSKGGSFIYKSGRNIAGYRPLKQDRLSFRKVGVKTKQLRIETEFKGKSSPKGRNLSKSFVEKTKSILKNGRAPKNKSAQSKATRLGKRRKMKASNISPKARQHYLNKFSNMMQQNYHPQNIQKRTVKIMDLAESIIVSISSLKNSFSLFLIERSRRGRESKHRQR